LFSEHLDEFQGLFRKEIAPKLHAQRLAELEGAPERLFAKVEDTMREAALMAAGLKLSPERLAETEQAGLKAILGGRLPKVSLYHPSAASPILPSYRGTTPVLQHSRRNQTSSSETT
jgi:hypothetical protein